MAKLVSVQEAIHHVESNHRVFVHGGAVTPHVLLDELVNQAHRLRNVEMIHIHTHGEPLYAHPSRRESFRVVNLFVGANMRPYLDFEGVDYLPCFLSEMHHLFRSGRRRPNVALIHVSPPDSHGFCSLGTSVDVAKAAVDTAGLVIAQVNQKVPRLHGDGILHESRIHFFVQGDGEIEQVHQDRPLSDLEMAVGRYVAELVEDGATLQTGIGAIPNAVLASLRNHRRLGIHTEMWSDGALDLILSGAVTNTEKNFHVGKSVSAFLIGTQRLYDFVHDNPSVILLEASYVNNPRIIARNKKVTAINSAVEVDLTGQVCADSVGAHIISGVGGQIDFIRGASLSEGGKPIIALLSRTRQGIPRIVPQLQQGAGVVTTRAHVHYVVTEYGVADLFGRTLGERAKALINVAHPEDRESLDREWFKVFRAKSKRVSPVEVPIRSQAQ